jgi:hypothetical protein
MANTETSSTLSTGLRTIFGVVLFIAWGAETILWVYDAFHALAGGTAGPAIRAVVALLLMILLACMEGLEVAVIDRWRELFPEGSTSSVLAGWLAARQLFVALIVTAATILAARPSIAIPFSSAAITNEVALAVFNLTWTGFTVLWFMQIFPKHLAAENPDRYLQHTQRTLFPIVDVVRQSGVAGPAVWTASAVESRLNWHAEPTLEKAPARHAESLADIWASLIPERPPATQRPPDDRTAGSTGS